MKARAASALQHARVHRQRKAVPQLKTLLSELRSLTTAASTVPFLPPVQRRMTQASRWLAQCIKELEQRQRSSSARRSLKAG
jgi:hypothetical protein